MLVKMVKSLFASAPDPRDPSERPRRTSSTEVAQGRRGLTKNGSLRFSSKVDASLRLLHRRQAVLDRVSWAARPPDTRDQLEERIGARSFAARQNLAAGSSGSLLTDVSGEFSDLLAELKDADERAEHMEARADALDELVGIGVLSPQLSLPQLVSDDSHSDEVESLLEKLRGRCPSGTA